MTFAGRDFLGRLVTGIGYCRKCRRLTPTVRDAEFHDVCGDCGLPAGLSPKVPVST